MYRKRKENNKKGHIRAQTRMRNCNSYGVCIDVALVKIDANTNMHVIVNLDIIKLVRVCFHQAIA